MPETLSTIVILGIALALAMDAFAVAMACSVALRSVSARQTFRLAFHFGLFQAFMPIAGWSAGHVAQSYIREWDHWVAFGLLVLLGGKSLYAAVRASDDEVLQSDPTRGVSLVVFSIATSIDALAVGLSLAMLHVSIWYPSAVIGVVTAAVTTLGVVIGSRLGARFGRRMELVGGIVLIAIGAKILFSHLA